MRRAGRAATRGLTLIEALVSIGVLALMGSLIYGAFDGMSRSRKGITRINDRYHQGRNAINKIARDLQMAYISLHQPLTLSQSVSKTQFVGKDDGDLDRVDFTSFSHKRIVEDAHESEQNELGYFASRNPDTGGMDLARREAKYIDTEPTRGGIVSVIAEDIRAFDIQYLDRADPASEGTWVDSWDTTNTPTPQTRLPAQVRVTLVLNGGPKDEPITFRTKVDIPLHLPLSFAIPR